MGKADVSFGVDNTVQWHTTQFKKIDLLPVFLGDQVVRVGQPNKRNFFIPPILLKGRQWIRSYSQYFHTALCELLIFITQARQLRAAIGSHKAAQEGKQDRFPAKIR